MISDPLPLQARSKVYSVPDGWGMLDENEYLRWLGSAKRSLESARGDLSRGDYNWTCFKAQQAAELAVKAILHDMGLPAYGHGVTKLLTSIEDEIPAPSELMQYAKTLDKYYVPTRYPSAWSHPMSSSD
ncbi:MAG: HEPN domain-containing protein [Candidatus Korarchaeum sp.]